jgi:hypothetical protein
MQLVVNITATLSATDLILKRPNVCHNGQPIDRATVVMARPWPGMNFGPTPKQGLTAKGWYREERIRKSRNSGMYGVV